jgi:predicted acylesterase/phospholipase RssA
MKKMGNYNILSIDGGGIRGLIALMQVVEIEKMCDGKLLNHFHMISGTSTGGIIATLIADGYTAKELIDIYREHGPYIFEKKWYRKGIFRAKYNDTYFNNVITKYCANRKMINLEADVIIPAYNISTMKVELFKRSNKFMDLPLRDAIRATASAQTYFEPWVINGEKYIDGGMAVNNPSEYCFAEAKDKVGGNMRINILSVGTGIVEKPLKGTGGMLKWAKPTVDILLAEMSQKTHELLNRYYKREDGTYLRCESYVKLSSGLIDDASRENIENMISDGNYSANCNRNSIKLFIENTKP